MPDTRARERVANIIKQNGAYLVNLSYPGSEDVVDSELYEAAGSLATAKRLARQGQPEWVEGGFRWEHDSENLWWLTALCLDDERGY